MRAARGGSWLFVVGSALVAVAMGPIACGTATSPPPTASVPVAPVASLAPDASPTVERDAGAASRAARLADRLFLGESITVDLSALRLIDSSGVGVLVSLFKRIRASGGEVRLEGLRDQPLAIFKLLRLDRVFPGSPGAPRAPGQPDS